MRAGGIGSIIVVRYYSFGGGDSRRRGERATGIAEASAV